MNKSVILDLVFGETCYAEKIEMNTNEIFTKSHEEMERKLKKLCEGMPQEEKDNFLWEMVRLQAEIDVATSETYFKEGFQLGMQIAMQSLLD